MKKGTMNSPNAVTIVQVGSNDQYVLCDDLFDLSCLCAAAIWACCLQGRNFCCRLRLIS